MLACCRESDPRGSTYTTMNGITPKLQCSSFLVMTYFLLGDYSMLPKKELHSSLCVGTMAL